jgi:hypothetical protein
MSQRGAAKFKQREITRTVKGIEAAGHVVDHVEITKDGFRVGIRQDNDGERQEPTNADEIRASK